MLGRHSRIKATNSSNVVPFPVDERSIERAEAGLGVTFPDAFRPKMMRMNGGNVESAVGDFKLYPFYDASDKKRIKRTMLFIVRETGAARDRYAFPENLVAIGDNGGGDALVYRIESNSSMKPTAKSRQLRHPNHA